MGKYGDNVQSTVNFCDANIISLWGKLIMICVFKCEFFLQILVLEKLTKYMNLKRTRFSQP